MAKTYVQSTTVVADTTPAVTTAFGSNTTAGNLILVLVVGDGSAASTVTGVTDSKSNTYTKVTDASINSVASQLNMVAYFTVVGTGGSGHTISVAWNDAVENVRVVAQEFSGFVGTPTLDQVKTASGSSTSPASGSTSTTSRSNELVVGALARAGDTASAVSAGATFSNLSTTAATVAASAESKVVLTTGGYNATFSLSVSRAWLAACITFYDSADPGPSTPTGGSFFVLF